MDRINWRRLKVSTAFLLFSTFSILYWAAFLILFKDQYTFEISTSIVVSIGCLISCLCFYGILRDLHNEDSLNITLLILYMFITGLGSTWSLWHNYPFGVAFYAAEASFLIFLF